jgi:hypothetical protein
MSGFRDQLTSTNRVPRVIAAFLTQRGSARVASALLSEAGLATTTATEKFKTTKKAYVSDANRLIVTKNATDNLTLSAAHTITAGKYGIVLVQLQTSNGAISTKVVASPQAYETAAEAQQHCPAPDSGKVAIGRFVIKADREETVGLRAIATLAASATTAKFKTTTTAEYKINDLDYSKAATDLLTFTLAHAVAADKWGTVLIQINAAGTISTKVPGATQSYNSRALAVAALSTADTGNTALGYLIIAADGAAFAANTDAISNTNGVTAVGALQISATAEKFKTTATAAYVIAGVDYTKGATDNLTFTAAHVITASKFGVILVQINAAGTISTKVPSATQAYNDAPTALAALPSPDAGNVQLGYIAIENNAGDWTANTDDLTNASDVTTAAFTDATEVNVVTYVDGTPDVTHDFVGATDPLTTVTLQIQEALG